MKQVMYILTKICTMEFDMKKTCPSADHWRHVDDGLVLTDGRRRDERSSASAISPSMISDLRNQNGADLFS